MLIPSSLRARLRWVLPFVLAALALPAAWAQLGELPPLELETVATELGSPLAVTHAGDQRLFVTLRTGEVVIVDGGSRLDPPFLDLRGQVSLGGERGLFSVAFHPDYPSNGFFFVNYTDLAGDTVIARFRVSNDPDRADPTSGITLLNIPQPFPNHNGGQVQFGPDGYLYIGMGDGGSGDDPQCTAQRADTLLGKMLRIDVDTNVNVPPFYGIPPDNPFAGPGNPADEIWALGLRNPYRFSFDRAAGDLYIADVGQSSREEIDFLPASSPGGANFGWKVMEGTVCRGSTAGCPGGAPPCNAPQYTPPVLEYGHDGGNCSVTGGYVYRGTDIPELDGAYLYGDFCSGNLWAAVPGSPAWEHQQLSPRLPRLTGFGEDLSGELYLVSLDGTLYRLTANRPLSPGRLELAATELTVGEAQAVADVEVRRVGGRDGAVTVAYSTRDAGATAGSDFAPTGGTLVWGDNDDAPRQFPIPILDDDIPEGDEDLEIVLSDPTGGATLGTSTATLTIGDDDQQKPCIPGPTVLCLLGDRYRVEITWRNFSDNTGRGEAVLLTSETGYFWFFNKENVEVVVKLLNACGEPQPRFWLFAAGLTNVETELTVTDTQSGTVKRYDNELGNRFQPVLDTESFATCP